MSDLHEGPSGYAIARVVQSELLRMGVGSETYQVGVNAWAVRCRVRDTQYAIDVLPNGAGYTLSSAQSSRVYRSAEALAARLKHIKGLP